MFKIKNKEIGKIKYGELHQYTPFKIDTELSFQEVVEMLEKCKLVFKEENQNQVQYAISQSLKGEFDEIFKDAKQEGLKVSLNNYEPDYDPGEFILDKNDLRLEMEIKDGALKVSFLHDELINLDKRISRMQEEYELASRIYGSRFVNSHERLLLLPLKVTLISNEIVWIQPVLYIFECKLGILKLEIPLVNVSVDQLYNNEIDEYVQKVENKWRIQNFEENIKLSELGGFFCQSLVDETHLKLVKANKGIDHVSLVDFEGIPLKMDKISDLCKEDIFRIICAPVEKRNGISYVEDAKKYFEKYAYGQKDIKYVTKTNGGCLSFCDKLLLDYCAQRYEKKKVEDLEIDEYYDVCNSVARDLQMNAEFALIVILLKKMNTLVEFLEKANATKNIYDISKEYNQNIIYINELQETCYGTVLDQTEAFEKMMYQYLHENSIKAKRDAIDTIIREEQQKKDDRLNKFLGRGGLMIAVLFGLPSIAETLKIIRSIFFKCLSDIPFISINNVSFLIWIILIVVIFICINDNEKNG